MLQLLPITGAEKTKGVENDLTRTITTHPSPRKRLINLLIATMRAMVAGMDVARNVTGKLALPIQYLLRCGFVCRYANEAVFNLESAMGLEPTLSSLEDWCANQLRFADKSDDKVLMKHLSISSRSCM